MEVPVLSMENLSLQGKTLLVREDLNVPVSAGVVTSDARLNAAIPTLNAALDAGAAVIVMSHLGRPVEGQAISDQPEMSLKPVALRLGELMQREIRLVENWQDGLHISPGTLIMLENVRVLTGEKSNDDVLAQRLADLCDIFVMDAFATAHRAHASTCGVAKFAPVACAGNLLLAELGALQKGLSAPRQPMLAVVGGAKVSTKIEVLESLADMADHIVVGGGIANTFLAAEGYEVGASLYEQDMTETAKRILGKTHVPLPVDVMVSEKFSADSVAVLKNVDELSEKDMILDLGPRTARNIAGLISNAGTILWNGPLGVFEFDQFGEGTRVLAEAIAASDGFSIAGGGDTLAAIEKYSVGSDISYISTGGGAFLEFVEGKKLPAVAILEQRALEHVGKLD
jgi:phosphoglycerate kinase